MRRVSVVGNSGSGKSTFAAALAERLGVPWLELDGLRHQPGWTEMPDDEFRRRVTCTVAGDAWVVDGNYPVVRELVCGRAEVVVWLDLPRAVVMRRIVRRTLTRMVLRHELWNGNREPLSNLFSLDPQRSVIAWAWTQHGAYRERYLGVMADPAWAHLRFVTLTSDAETASFLATAT